MKLTKKQLKILNFSLWEQSKESNLNIIIVKNVPIIQETTALSKSGQDYLKSGFVLWQISMKGSDQIK